MTVARCHHRRVQMETYIGDRNLGVLIGIWVAIIIGACCALACLCSVLRWFLWCFCPCCSRGGASDEEGPGQTGAAV
jgi:hypothetical protein